MIEGMKLYDLYRDAMRMHSSTEYPSWFNLDREVQRGWAELARMRP